ANVSYWHTADIPRRMGPVCLGTESRQSGLGQLESETCQKQKCRRSDNAARIIRVCWAAASLGERVALQTTSPKATIGGSHRYASLAHRIEPPVAVGLVFVCSYVCGEGP